MGKFKKKTAIADIPAKEAAVIAAMADGVPPDQAVAAAGYNLPDNGSGTALGKVIWNKNVDSNKCMINALEEVGVSPVSIAQKLKDKMDAKTVVSMGRGEVMEVDDHSIQLKAADMMLKVVGGYAAKKTEVTEMKFEEILIHIEGLD